MRVLPDNPDKELSNYQGLIEEFVQPRLARIPGVSRADVRAPFTGVVTSRVHRAGEDVARGEVLAQMTDIRNMEVRAFVPLKHLPRTMVGEPIDVFASNTTYSGNIRSLVPTGDIRSQTFEARIDLPLGASELWTVGQLVSVEISIGESSGDLIGVSGSLAAGDRVAVRGAENLKEGAEVKIMVSQSVASKTAT